MAPPSSPAQQLMAYQLAVTQVRASVLRYAELSWGASRSYRDADIERLVAKLVPRVQAGQIRIADLTAVYLGNLEGGRKVLVDRDYVTQGRGVPAEEVYQRPASVVYTELANGKTFDIALAMGANRLKSLVSMDMQMAKVRQSSASLQASNYEAYRRVLTGKESCGLCVIASTMSYSVKDLLPIHPGCDCDVAPIRSASQIPHVLDEELLEATHDRVFDFTGDADRAGRAPDYKQLIIVHKHGEHGPSLRWRGEKFTGPAT